MKLLTRLQLPVDRGALDVPDPPMPLNTPATCSGCGSALPAPESGRLSSVGVCGACGAHARLGARARIASLADAGSFRELWPDLRPGDPLGFNDGLPYSERIAEQQERTGLAEALVVGAASVEGHEVVLAVLDFSFLGGSMSTVVGEKITRATEFASKERRPLVTVVGSGGARMQEGILALLQMAKTAAAVNRLRAEGVPYISILTDPTTGGVFASFASLGDLVGAEPGALIGFAGPRVVEQTIGRPLPPGSHTAEFLLAHGILDAVLPRSKLRGYVATALAALAPASNRPKLDRPQPASRPTGFPDAWAEVRAARSPDRPTAIDYLQRLVTSFVELHGDRAGFDDPAVVAGFGRLADLPIAVVGFERGRSDGLDERGGRPCPEGFRKAQRLLRLAARLRLPVLALIDTPGAYPGVESEERGLAGQIAATLALMAELPCPTIAAIIGEGGSGAAVALAAADRVLIQEHAIYSVIGPEGAAAILYRDAGRAASVAPRLKLTAHDLSDLGVADTVIPEPEGGARSDPDAAARLLGTHVAWALHELQGRSRDRLLRARRDRYRRIGLAFVQGERRGTAADRVIGLVRRVAPWIGETPGDAPAEPVAAPERASAGTNA